MEKMPIDVENEFPPPSPASNDRYSRLVALERMGVVKDYHSIRLQTVLIVGVGGIGSVTAEMLTRCGIGKLILFDYDAVEAANMNRLFYTPHHIGQSKVQACVESLGKINSEVLLEPYNNNICIDYELLLDRISKGGIGGERVTLVLSCVDNYAARVTISQACNETSQAWMNSGVSEDAVSGQIQTCIPGKSACFQCAPPLIVSTGGNEREIKRDLVCTASLPTTMGIVAGILVQNALKFILDFGDITWFLGYNSLQDFFPSYPIAPNPECRDAWCIRRQKEFIATGESFPPQKVGGEATSMVDTNKSTVENEWGITVVNEEETKVFVDTNSQVAEVSTEDGHLLKTVDDSKDPPSLPDKGMEHLSVTDMANQLRDLML